MSWSCLAVLEEYALRYSLVPRSAACRPPKLRRFTSGSTSPIQFDGKNDGMHLTPATSAARGGTRTDSNLSVTRIDHFLAVPPGRGDGLNAAVVVARALFTAGEKSYTRRQYIR